MVRHLKYVCVALVALMTMSACTIRPDGVLGKRKFQSLLIDLHRTDGLIQVKGLNYGHDYDVNAYYQFILDKHGVTQAQFDSTLVWYTDHPLLFNRVYPRVLEKIKKEQEMYELMSEEIMAQRAEERARKRNANLWRKDLERLTEPRYYGLWRDTFTLAIAPPLMPDKPIFIRPEEPAEE